MGEILSSSVISTHSFRERVEGMCTLEKRGNIFLLTLTGIHDDHLFHPDLVYSLRAALAHVRSEATKASALITTAQGKFFSNGLDLKWLLVDRARQQLLSEMVRSLVSDLVTLPMPTIAAVTGHACGAGFVFTLCHHYILMRKDRGFLYMSELDFGIRIPVWHSALVRSKLGPPMVWREVLLKGAKLTADVAAQMGIVDSSHTGADQTVGAAVKLGEELVSRNWDGNVYAHIRKTLYVELLNALASDETAGHYGATSKTMSKL